MLYKYRVYYAVYAVEISLLKKIENCRKSAYMTPCISIVLEAAQPYGEDTMQRALSCMLDMSRSAA